MTTRTIRNGRILSLPVDQWTSCLLNVTGTFWTACFRALPLWTTNNRRDWFGSSSSIRLRRTRLRSLRGSFVRRW